MHIERAPGASCPRTGNGWPSAIAPKDNRDLQASRLILKHGVNPAVAAQIAALAWPAVTP